MLRRISFKRITNILFSKDIDENENEAEKKYEKRTPANETSHKEYWNKGN